MFSGPRTDFDGYYYERARVRVARNFFSKKKTRDISVADEEHTEEHHKTTTTTNNVGTVNSLLDWISRIVQDIIPPVMKEKSNIPNEKRKLPPIKLSSFIDPREPWLLVPDGNLLGESVKSVVNIGSTEPIMSLTIFFHVLCLFS